MTIRTVPSSRIRAHANCLQCQLTYKLGPILMQRATKLIEDIKHLSYDERLENLGLSRLTTRRVRSDLIQTFKIINGIDKVDNSLFLFRN